MYYILFFHPILEQSAAGASANLPDPQHENWIWISWKSSAETLGMFRNKVLANLYYSMQTKLLQESTPKPVWMKS